MNILIKALIISLMIISPYLLCAQETSDDLLEKAYASQKEQLKDSASFYFRKAREGFEQAADYNKVVECIAGENRNYLSADRVTYVAENGKSAIDLVDQGKASENSEYVVEILAQLSRDNWYAKGNFPAALEYIDRGMKICENADFDAAPYQIKLYTEYGYTYGYSGEFDNSEKYFRKALDLTLEHFGPDSEQAADRYTDMVFPLIQKSEWEKAEVALKKATELNIKIRGPEHISVLKNYNNLGYIYLEKFDNELAIMYLNKAITMIREKFGEEHRSVGIGYMNLGASYHNQGDYQNCVIYSLKAAQNFEKSIGSNNPYMGIVLLNTANSYNSLQNRDSALYYYDQVLSLKKTLYGEQHFEIVNTYGYMSDFYIKNQMYDEALKVILASEKLADEILPSKHKLSASNHIQHSLYYSATGNLELSLEEIQLALIGLVVSFNDTDISKNPSLDEEIISTRILLDALIQKTRVLFDSYKKTGDPEFLNLAYKTALITDRAIDKLRIEYQTPNSKKVLLSRTEEFFENSLDIHFELYQQNKSTEYANSAFYLIEKSKSILLIEKVRSSEISGSVILPDSIRIQEKSLSRGIATLSEQLFDARIKEDTSAIAKLENELFLKKRNHDLLLNHLQENYPEYFSIQYQIFNVSPDLFANSLEEGNLIVNYFLGSDHMYVVDLSKDKTQFHKLSLDNSIRDDLQKFTTSFGTRTFDPELSQKIFNEILKPVLDERDEEKFSLITLMPDDILHYIPFETLVVAIRDRPEYLIELYAINYLHSVPQRDSKNDNQVALSYVGFSPEYQLKNNPLLATRSAKDVAISEKLMQLPMTEVEVRESASLLNGSSFLSQEATEQNFKAVAPDAGIIHIAAHTVIDDDDPLYSKLVFSPGADTLEDGLLHTYELYNMNLNAQLACLSACNTGFGQLTNGEGVVSLAKGFYYAGVDNILMSLWAVPDNSTSIIMTEFYKELKEGKGKADALREAKLRYLSNADANASDPYFWAAFTMIGDNSSVKTDNGMNFWFWGLVLVAGIGIVLLLVRVFK